MKILLLGFWHTEYCVKLANSLSKYLAVKLMLPSNIAGDIIEFLSPTVSLELFQKVKKQTFGGVFR